MIRHRVHRTKLWARAAIRSPRLVGRTLVRSIPDRIWYSVLVPVTLLAIGTVGYPIIEGEPWTAFDGFYMTAITLTTIGYGELHPLSQIGLPLRGRRPFATPLSVTNVLSPPMLTPRLTLPIPTARLPATPPSRRPSTCLTAIPRLRTLRHEQLLAPLEQAAANAKPTPRPWPERCRTLK